ncbi:kinesin-related protein 7 [Drosophila busckii]|uniref:kinesin-related protein 7 n=1 Tax=Drosophila busckii TaxID=30019 RepID=UPI00083EA567|nr:kinesin-related protein 7 [Drosophila busckii]
MEQILWLLLVIFLLQSNATPLESEAAKSVKKELAHDVAVQQKQQQQQQQQQQQTGEPNQQPAAATKTATTEDVVVISERSQPKLPVEDVQIEHSKLNNNAGLPETYTSLFYMFVGISSIALLYLVLRLYRLRLSRAERKYGVQGDRANQELTPLPMAIEDVNSDDEEDHTLFEVRQSIRIL